MHEASHYEDARNKESCENREGTANRAVRTSVTLANDMYAEKAAIDNFHSYYGGTE